MTKSRTNADNVTADIAGITAGTGITGGGTSGTVTITNDMATTIAAAGDLIYGTANDAYAALSLGTAGKVLKVNSGATAPEWAVDPTTDVVTTAGDLIYGTGADAVARLGIGTAGQVLKVNSGATAPEWGSSGTTWTLRQGSAEFLHTVAYNGSNLYVAVGNNATMFTSPNGITWTSRTSGFGANGIYWVAYGNGLFVAVGDNATLSTSTDGITWTARTSNMGAGLPINHVVYANSIWVAVGRGGGTDNTGGIIYSTDGITWTRKSQSLTVGTTYYAASWNGTNWIVAAALSTNNYLYASTPSGTWTVGHDGSSQILRTIFWDGTRNWVLAGTNALRYSTSATLGTTTGITNITGFTQSGEQTGKSGQYYYDGRIYIFTSTAPGTLTDVSLTPIQTNYLTPGARTFAPGNVSTVSEFSNLFISTVGRIVYSMNGIYTSF